MKWDFFQGDFSSGEISERIKGHADAAIWKAAAGRIANCVPTPEGPVGSRSGAEFIASLPDNVGNAEEYPVKHVSLEGHPHSGWMLELGNSHLRVLDKRGAVPLFRFPGPQACGVEPQAWNPVNGWLSALAQAGNGVWVDRREEKFYFRMPATGGILGSNPMTSVLFPNDIIKPAGSNGSYNFKFIISGDAMTLRVFCDGTGDHAGAVLVNDVVYLPGIYSVNFQPGTSGFQIRWTQPGQNASPSASNIWGMQLWRDNALFQMGMPPTFGGGTPAMNLNSLRSAAFWIYDHAGIGSDRYSVVMVIPGLGPFGLHYFPASGGWEVIPTSAFVDIDLGVQRNITSVAAYQGRLWFGCSDGRIIATEVGYGANDGGGIFKFKFTTGAALAANPLDLRLSTTAHTVAWMNILRGLLIGTTAQEMGFTMNAALALDPAAGTAFDVLEHSWNGSDADLPALNVMDKVLYPLPGRKRLKMAGFSFQSAAGLASTDFSVLGEHLLSTGIRSYCGLKGAIPRVVFAVEDGTAAVATLSEKGDAAWSRFTLPAPVSDIYCVTSVTTKWGQELWIGTTNGFTLRVAQLDSFVEPLKKPTVRPDTFTYPPSALYHDVTLEAPILDCFVRAPVWFDGANPGTIYAAYSPPGSALEAATNNLHVLVMVNGNFMGDVQVNWALPHFNGLTNGLVLPRAWGLDATWTDKNGNRFPSEAVYGLPYVEHRVTSLPLEGGNPAGTSQGQKSRKPQLYVRFINSYMPLVNGDRPPEIDPETDILDVIAGRVTGIRRCTELEYQRGATVDIVMDMPLRFEFSAIFGGTQTNKL